MQHGQDSRESIIVGCVYLRSIFCLPLLQLSSSWQTNGWIVSSTHSAHADCATSSVGDAENTRKKMSRCGDYRLFGILHSKENQFFILSKEVWVLSFYSSINAFPLFRTSFGGTYQTKSLLSPLEHSKRCTLDVAVQVKSLTQLLHNPILFSSHTGRCTFHTFFTTSLKFWRSTIVGESAEFDE